MIESKRRYYSPRLNDAMVFIGATAAALGLYRTSLGAFFYDDCKIRLWSFRVILTTILNVTTAATPCLIAWTLASLSRWRGVPSQLRRGIWFEPGYTACCLMSASTGIYATVLLITYLSCGQVTDENMQRAYLLFTVLSAIVLCIAWTTMAFRGQWRTPIIWLGWLGVFLGTCWIVFGLLFPAVILLLAMLQMID